MQIQLASICVPTDFSNHADHAVMYAATLAQRFGAKLHLIHVIPDVIFGGFDPGVVGPTENMIQNFERQALECLQESAKRTGVNRPEVTTAVRRGIPFQQICEYVKQANVDLVVIGTHGRTGIARLLLGSVAERVVRSCPCPVLTVHDPEHEFVVPE